MPEYIQEGDNGIAVIGSLSLLEVIDMLENPPSIVSIDTETISVKDKTCLGIGVGLSPSVGVYIRVQPDPSPYTRLLENIVENPHITKIYHNAMFDLETLQNAGFSPETHNIEDTSIMAQVMAMRPHLKSLAYHELKRNINEITDIMPKKRGANMLDVSWEDTAYKCIIDCTVTLALYEKLKEKLGYNNGRTNGAAECYQVDRKLISLLQKMSNRGIALREERVNYWYSEVSKEVLFYKDLCENKYGFNPGSPSQVGLTLANRGTVLPMKRNSRSKYALITDEDILEKVADPLARIVLNYRKVAKLKGTYIEPWLGKERAYTHFRIDLATGRLASYNRNLQNVPAQPRNMRDVFAPDSGQWMYPDLSQVEMRVFSFLTKDPTMVNAYKEGEDIHWITQQALWPGTSSKDEVLRKRSKTFNFAMIFDALAETLANRTGLPVEACAVFKELWLQRYPVAAAWMEEQKRKEVDYVETLFGRKMLLPDPAERSFEHTDKCKINYQVQGTAADYIKRMMWHLSYMDIALSVHDELLIDGEYEIPQEITMLYPGLITPFGEIKKGKVWE
jgi:DNA polymerase I